MNDTTAFVPLLSDSVRVARFIVRPWIEAPRPVSPWLIGVVEVAVLVVFALIVRRLTRVEEIEGP